MITPNKFVTFEQSVISKLPFVLTAIGESLSIKVADLFEECAEHFGGVDEFIYALDVLYALDRIQLKQSGEVQLA